MYIKEGRGFQDKGLKGGLTKSIYIKEGNGSLARG
jgi:hypothetical protein